MWFFIGIISFIIIGVVDSFYIVILILMTGFRYNQLNFPSGVINLLRKEDKLTKKVMLTIQLVVIVLFYLSIILIVVSALYYFI
jgi:hypothetical protein